MTFANWLRARNIDQQQLEPEMLAALKSQFEKEQPAKTVLVIPDSVDERWQRAFWLPTHQ